MSDRGEMLCKILESDLERLAGEREKAEDMIARGKLILERVDRQEKEAKEQINAL